MRGNFLKWLPGVLTVCLISCNLSDFQFDKLSQETGLHPMIYRPFASGKYAVKDYVAVPGFGSTPVTMDSLNFKLISYDLKGMKLNTDGTDSMVVIIKTINEIPMKYRYQLSYPGRIMDSGTDTLRSAPINTQGDVMSESRDSLEFMLNAADVVNLGKATRMDLRIVLYQPDKGVVLANVLKSSQLSFSIAFRAPYNLFKP
jgi:hypothetical protein